MLAGRRDRIHFPLHQFCWAHLLRDFQAMVDRKNAGSKTGEELLKLAKSMFGLWFSVRDKTLTREQFREKVKPIRQGILLPGHAAPEKNVGLRNAIRPFRC